MSRSRSRSPVHRHRRTSSRSRSPSAPRRGPIVVAIEGPIGAGKSTLCMQVKRYLEGQGWRVRVVQEPVQKWEDSGLLKQFYEDKARHSLHFQLNAFMDRIETVVEASKAEPAPDVYVLERSIFSDTIFVQTLMREGNMTTPQMETYKRLWDRWRVEMPFVVDAFVFLDTDPVTSNKRVVARDRGSETHTRDRKSDTCGIPLSYQEMLSRFHKLRFSPGTVTPTEDEQKHMERFPFPATPCFVVPERLANGDFRSGGEQHNDTMETLWSWLQELGFVTRTTKRVPSSPRSPTMKDVENNSPKTVALARDRLVDVVR